MTEKISRLAQSERLARLRLIRSENVGPITFLKLLDRFGSAANALERLPELVRGAGGSRPPKICSRTDAVREIEAARKLNARPIVFGDPDYPPLLAATDDPPAVFYVLGHAGLLTRDLVAMVGARNASLNGRKLAERFARDLGTAGYGVVSGMARGLDASAHLGSLDTGSIAVLAGGIDVIYPRENRELYAAIAERGLIVSEMPPGTVPQARHFPRRNRIVSGLALGVVVVEATRRSGSLITARLAAEQGREVFAIPGNPMDPRAAGTNALIKQGAQLCDSADDILGALQTATKHPMHEDASPGFRDAPVPAPDPETLSATRADLIDLLSPSPVEIDELIRISGLSAALVATVLLELELAGRLDRHPGNRVALSDISHRDSE